MNKDQDPEDLILDNFQFSLLLLSHRFGAINCQIPSTYDFRNLTTIISEHKMSHTLTLDFSTFFESTDGINLFPAALAFVSLTKIFRAISTLKPLRRLDLKLPNLNPRTFSALTKSLERLKCLTSLTLNLQTQQTKNHSIQGLLLRKWGFYLKTLQKLQLGPNIVPKFFLNLSTRLNKLRILDLDLTPWKLKNEIASKQLFSSLFKVRRYLYTLKLSKHSSPGQNADLAIHNDLIMKSISVAICNMKECKYVDLSFLNGSPLTVSGLNYLSILKNATISQKIILDLKLMDPPLQYHLQSTRELRKTLNSIPNLKSLSLDLREIKSYHLIYSSIAEGLEHIENLEEFSLKYAFKEPSVRSFWAITQGLSAQRNIKKLQLKSEMFKDNIKDEFEALDTVFETCKSLQTLKYHTVNPINLTNFPTSTLRKCQKLENIDFSIPGRNITDLDMRELSDMLFPLKGLKMLKLKLFDSQFSNSGLEMLAEGLSEAALLESLTLKFSNSKLSTGALFIVSSIMNNAKLLKTLKINLRDSEELEDSDMIYLGIGLQGCENLEKFECKIKGDKSLTDDGLLSLGYEVKNCKKLKFIHMHCFECGFTQAGLREFKKILKGKSFVNIQAEH